MTGPELEIMLSADRAATDARLTDRARRLAEVPPPVENQRSIEVTVCRVGTEDYAIELSLLRGVYPAVGLTPVPCTPSFVAGLFNLRGEILTVIDLAAILGLTASDRSEVLVVETEQVRVGVLLGKVLGVRRIALDSLDRALVGSSFTRGIADATTALLDMEAVLADRRFDLGGHQ